MTDAEMEILNLAGAGSSRTSFSYRHPTCTATLSILPAQCCTGRQLIGHVSVATVTGGGLSQRQWTRRLTQQPDEHLADRSSVPQRGVPTVRPRSGRGFVHRYETEGAAI